MDTNKVINYMDQNQLLAWSVFSSDYEYYRQVLIYSNDLMFQFFSLLTLLLNTCLCIDLVLTLKSPFTPAKKRMKLYLGLSIILCIPLAFLTKPSIDKLDKCKSFIIYIKVLIVA